MTWAASANNGGTAITAYQVYFNQGPITNTFVVYSTVSQATLTETITAVTSGDPYIIRIVTQNRLGSSPASLETTIYAASKPEAPDAPTRVANTFSQTTIDLEWSANGTGGSGITGYEIWWNGGGTGPVTGLRQTIASGAQTSA